MKAIFYFIVLLSYISFSQNNSTYTVTENGMMTANPKYRFMNPKTHIMMDIFKHASINMAQGGSSNIANHTHDTVFQGLVENGLGGTEMIIKCNTCLKYYKKLEQRIEAFMAKHKLSANLN